MISSMMHDLIYRSAWACTYPCGDCQVITTVCHYRIHVAAFCDLELYTVFSQVHVQ